MRTTDFSAAPRLAQAEAMLAGGQRYASVRMLASALPRWRRLIGDLRRAPGYCAHRLYVERPRTVGLLAWFDTTEELQHALQGSEHEWFTHNSVGSAAAGAASRGVTERFMRIFAADPHGYSNGVWRAEDQRMAHEERFTPLSTERQAPKVRRSARLRSVPGPAADRR
ncbi:hypothetical protein BJY21_001093 [Kineosphaera limosa]|uniref:ABM domain-containing protein n=1 Tax=Kineosphaera limosa NBRC 100340 TaxID=1184609 RepID=K6W8N2_9MICO|nr:hypothetical protein [Kineosphaera limosa]NYD99908.1 hypothetical protein [Kineosphaera limosa]GAB95555.1 hypothetical protein KILIM_022_00400 [Kineosphaera limosa NBRC 100340]